VVHAFTTPEDLLTQQAGAAAALPAKPGTAAAATPQAEDAPENHRLFISPTGTTGGF
jgi:hypothetical protein